MRKIKFRGIDSCTGKYVYGYYNPFMNAEELPMISTKAGEVEVAAESVAQLVGVDKNGREVYEGDKVVDDFGNVMAAGFVVIHIERMSLLGATKCGR